MHDKNREEAGISVRWWALIERQLAGVRPGALLVHACIRIGEVAAATPPQGYSAVGAVHAAQRETGRVQGEVGVKEASAAGEDGGATGAGDGPPPLAASVSLSAGLATLLAVLLLLLLLLQSAVGLGSLRVLKEDAVGRRSALAVSYRGGVRRVCVDEHGLRVAGDRLVIAADVPLHFSAVQRVHSWDRTAGVAPQSSVLVQRGGAAVAVLHPEKFLDAVVHVSGAILDEHSQRPGQHQQGCQPKGNLGIVPRHSVRVDVGYQIFPEVDVLELHPLPGFHVVIQALDFREEPGPLVEVIVFGSSLGEAKTLGEAQPSCRVSLQAPEVARHVFHPAAAVVELPLCHVGVDSLVVHLRGGVSVPIAVAGDLARAPHKVVADGLPPYAGLGLPHPQNSFVHAVHVCLVLQLAPGPAVPALGHVYDVQHEQEGQGDVDVAIGAGAVVVDHRVSSGAHPRDASQ